MALPSKSLIKFYKIVISFLRASDNRCIYTIFKQGLIFMKMPNGYGSVVKLKGNRRKPYAVRVSYRCEEDGIVKRKKKYLAYFTKRESALQYLAEMNGSNVIPEHQKYTDILTFAELYEKWKSYRKSLKNAPGAATWKNYDIAFQHFAAVHDLKIINIKLSIFRTA